MSEKDLISQVSQLLKEHLETVADMLDAQTNEIKITIENDITKRLDALTDGYLLVHEKQAELTGLGDSLQARVSILESMSA